MRVIDLLTQLQTMDRNKEILCQVVPQQKPQSPYEVGAWSMNFSLVEVQGTNLVQLRVEHPRLMRLPDEGWEALQ